MRRSPMNMGIANDGGGGKLKRTHAAVEQGNAQPPFQLLYLLAGGRLAYPIEAGAPADAFRLRYIPENLDVIEYQTASIS